MQTGEETDQVDCWLSVNWAYNLSFIPKFRLNKTFIVTRLIQYGVEA